MTILTANFALPDDLVLWLNQDRQINRYTKAIIFIFLYVTYFVSSISVYVYIYISANNIKIFSVKKTFVCKFIGKYVKSN